MVGWGTRNARAGAGSQRRVSNSSARPLLGLCAVVGGSGVLHVVVPGPYRRIVPAPLRPRAAMIVAASGACEIACAGLLAVPRTRRLGALATAALFVAVFPANVQMALDTVVADPPSATLWKVGAWLRLPLQIPLVLWALRFRHAPGR